jgi:hypothetical protein
MATHAIPHIPADVPYGFRPAFLMITAGGAFNAHWAFLFPRLRDVAHGKRVHAIGDKRSGFEVEVLRDFDLTESDDAKKYVFLSWIHEQYMSDAVTGTIINDPNLAEDKLEKVALGVPAPGPSIVRLLIPSYATRI